MRTEASEPLVAYNTPNLQGLKNRIIESLDTAVDEEKLQRCLELLSEDEMPCRFTEEELDFIINYDIKYRMGDELNEE